MLLKLAWRNIWRNKRRTLITISSVVFAVLFAIVMRSMQNGSYDKMIDNIVSFYTGYIQLKPLNYNEDPGLHNNLAYTDSLNASLIEVKHINGITPRVETFALATYKNISKGVLVTGIDPESEANLSSLDKKVTIGKYLSSDDKGILLGEGLSEYLNLGIGDSLILLGQGIYGMSAAGIYPVIGIVQLGSPQLNNQMVFMPIKEAQWFTGIEDKVTSVIINLDHSKSISGVMVDLKNKFDDRYDILSWEDMMPELVQMIEADNAGGVIMLFVLYMIIGFGILGTIIMMTAERSYEFGLLIAIGLKRLQLFLIVFIEALTLSLIGSLGGIVLSLPITIYFYFNPIRFTGDMAKSIESYGMEPIMPFSLDPALFWSQALTVLFITIILALYPLKVLLRLKPVNAMRV